MVANFEDFKTYAGRIWNSKVKIPDYAYFCWRWDEQYWRGSRVLDARAYDPIEDPDLWNNVLETFVCNQEIHRILVKMKISQSTDTYSIREEIWEIYGSKPTLLLSMWQWAKSSNAWSVCSYYATENCTHSACMAQRHVDNLGKLEMDSPDHYAPAETQRELNPHLVSFYLKLRKDRKEALRNGLYSRSIVFVDSLQNYFSVMYHKRIPKLVEDAVEDLTIQTNPDVSFLRTDEEQDACHRSRSNEVQESDPVPYVSFAVSGSGKTQAVFNILAANWGHYLISGHLPDTQTDHKRHWEPCRGGASADTQWLFELLEMLKQDDSQSLPSDLYSNAIVQLMTNRQNFMEKWKILVEKKFSDPNLQKSIYWLLFQTTCTPKYDLFQEALKWRMVFDLHSLPTESSSRLTEFLPTFLDEAQNELEPLWNEQPPLSHFIKATSLSKYRISISGTSLRIKDCQEVVRRSGFHIIQPQNKESAMYLLLRTFRNLMDPEECSQFAKELGDRVSQGYQANPYPSELLDSWVGQVRTNIMGIYSSFIYTKEFSNILGNFYFTLASQKATRTKDERTRRLLKKTKDFIIPVLSSYYSTRLGDFLSHSKYGLEHKYFKPDKPLSREVMLEKILTEFHICIWKSTRPASPDVSDDPADRRIGPHERRFMGFLREDLTSFALSQKPKTSFLRILSDRCFSTLLHSHVKRLLSRIAYFSSLGDKTFKREFWRIACPETIVFEDTENADGRQTFFQRSKDLLETYNKKNSLTASEMQSAIDEAERRFREAFMLKTPVNDHSEMKGQCGIARYSTLFRGRICWSITYIEHMFASYLRRLELDPARMDLSSSQINPSVDVNGGIQIDQAEIERMAKESAEYIKSSLKHRIEVLKGRGHHLLLKDLYFTAIRADLLHKPTIFPTDKSARMITEGFAILVPAESEFPKPTYAPKQQLSEPIVLDAVIEYLRDVQHDDEEKLENVLQNFLFDNQDDASNFGKVVEFYFAWSLGGLFFQSSTSADLSLEARELFRGKISQANFIPAQSHTCIQVLGKIQQYEEYELEEALPELKSDLTLGSTITFAQWLRRVRNGLFFPTFYFPSTSAGPDIVFCLKCRVTRKRILCAFQIKTGEKCDKSDAFRLIRTLDPKLWFWTAPNLRKDLVDELAHWQPNRFLTALIITSRTSLEFFASKADFYEGMRQLQPHIYQRELYSKVYQTQIYEDLKFAVSDRKEKEPLSEDTREILSKVESLAKELNLAIPDSKPPDSKTFAKDIIDLVEKAIEGPAKAAESIYKAPGKREEGGTAQNDVPMPDSNKDGRPAQNDHMANGYYFVILDDLDLKTFLGPTFFYLCKAMKEVEILKNENIAEEEAALKKKTFPCPVGGCKRNQDAYFYEGRLNNHILREHPNEPEAKRVKLDARARKSSTKAKEVKDDPNALKFASMGI